MLKVSRNLYNISKSVLGGLSSVNGSETSTTTRVRTDFIGINNSEITVSIDANDNYGIVNSYYYDENKNYIGSVQPSGVSGSTKNETFTVPNGSRYVRVTFCIYDLPTMDVNLIAFLQSKIQIEQGSTATPYMSYGQIYADGIVETIEVHGKNLFDGNNWAVLPNAPITIIDANTMQVSAYPYLERYNYFDLPPHKQEMRLSFHCKTLSISGGAAVRLDLLGQGAVLSSLTISLVYEGYEQDFVIRVPINCTQLIWGNWAYGGSVELSNIQLEQGSTATVYEPYFNGGTATAEMLLKVGQYKDEQSILDGVVTRNVGIKVLDGSENYIYGSPFGEMFCINNFFPAFPNIPTRLVLSTHFIGADVTPAIGSRNGHITRGQTGESVGIGYSALNGDITAFRQYLADQYNAGTPVIIVYPLATPTTEQVAGQTLTLTRGTNIIDITQASLDNLELEVTVK